MHAETTIPQTFPHDYHRCQDRAIRGRRLLPVRILRGLEYGLASSDVLTHYSDFKMLRSDPGS